MSGLLLIRLDGALLITLEDNNWTQLERCWSRWWDVGKREWSINSSYSRVFVALHILFHFWLQLSSRSRIWSPAILTASVERRVRVPVPVWFSVQIPRSAGESTPSFVMKIWRLQNLLCSKTAHFNAYSNIISWVSNVIKMKVATSLPEDQIRLSFSSTLYRKM